MMKKFKILFLAIALMAGTALTAQVGINTSNSAPDGSAMLDVKSTEKGFLPPRMTSAQIGAISSPAAGLMVFNTYLHTLVFYDGTNWRRTDGRLMFYIGQSYGGGIIFYIDETEEHGLIITTSSQGLATWGCYGTEIAGTSSAIGSGQANTTLILDGCSTEGIAARICDELVINGYDDWFLPSKDELMEIWANKAIINATAVANGGSALDISFYWSSTEWNSTNGGWLRFEYGIYDYGRKHFNAGVRAVRAF